MGSTRLDHRGVLEVSGPEARAFLDRIVTNDLDPIAPGRAGYGALLSPQGKILADFILFVGGSDDATFLLDTPAAAMGDLAKRLTLYRLRAKITISERGDLAVVAGWDDAAAPADAVAFAPDPRLAALGWRALVPSISPRPQHEGVDAYEAHRVRLGIPEGGRDFAFGDAFPHEALMDQLGGVAFDKGCYVGQEVVSRMQHRGTARTRIVPVRYDGEAPPAGTEIVAGDRNIGKSGTGRGELGLATLRLDRAADALAARERLTAAGIGFAVEPRDWIRFALPSAPADTAA
jgi:folate-binding protein YgfZ